MRVVVIDVLQGILFALVVAHVLWTAFMHVCTWSYFARHGDPGHRRTYQPTVSIIKPVKGVDQSAVETFRSFC